MRLIPRSESPWPYQDRNWAKDVNTVTPSRTSLISPSQLQGGGGLNDLQAYKLILYETVSLIITRLVSMNMEFFSLTVLTQSSQVGVNELILIAFIYIVGLDSFWLAFLGLLTQRDFDIFWISRLRLIETGIDVGCQDQDSLRLKIPWMLILGLIEDEKFLGCCDRDSSRLGFGSMTNQRRISIYLENHPILGCFQARSNDDFHDSCPLGSGFHRVKILIACLPA